MGSRRWGPWQEIEPDQSDWVEQLATYEGSATIYRNNLYQVIIRAIPAREGPGAHPPMQHLSIKRLDKAPIRDWRDLQRIKNELVGVHAEGAELFPSEKRLVDTSNQYHMWCVLPPHAFPFGFDERFVMEEPMEGARQRPWTEEARPDDLVTPEEREAMLRRYRERLEGGDHG